MPVQIKLKNNTSKSVKPASKTAVANKTGTVAKIPVKVTAVTQEKSKLTSATVETPLPGASKSEEDNFSHNTSGSDRQIIPVPAADVLEKNLGMPVGEDVSESTLDRANSRLYGIGVLIASIIIAVAIIIYSLSIRTYNIKQESLITPTPPPPTPTPTVIVRPDITFEVLNGSGIRGAAGKAADSIKGIGYRVEGIGNAEKNVSKTQLYLLTQNFKDKEAIISDLIKDFPGIEYGGEFASNTVEARLVVGKE